MKRRLSLSFLVFCATACTSPAERYPCENFDWYEIGRRDGASGATLDRVDRYHVQCPSEFDPNADAMYRNGRNAGLVEYCTGRNGFELGRMRIAYQSVCPSINEKDFLESYSKGETARKLELENQRLTAEIDSLSQQVMSRSPSDDREKISSQIDDLKKKRTENDQKILQISR